MLHLNTTSECCFVGVIAMMAGTASVSILIAVPDPVLMAEYRTALLYAGYPVGLAADGIQCLRRIREFRPGLIVLDVDLLWGGADGVMDVLQDEPAEPPRSVLVIGSRGSRSALYRVSRFAVTDYQLKPLSAQRLARRVDDLLASKCGAISQDRIGGSRHE
ncbi:MAG TPA: response regulator [Planctomycetaceae bacterium]